MNPLQQSTEQMSPLARWWIRPCGGRDVLRVALPLIISTASWTLMNFIDRMFLLWHSPSEMAAAMPAGMLLFTLLCFPLGVASYVNTFVAQYHGTGQNERIGSAIWQAMRIGWISTPPLFSRRFHWRHGYSVWWDTARRLRHLRSSTIKCLRSAPEVS